MLQNCFSLNARKIVGGTNIALAQPTSGSVGVQKSKIELTATADISLC